MTLLPISCANSGGCSPLDSGECGSSRPLAGTYSRGGHTRLLRAVLANCAVSFWQMPGQAEGRQDAVVEEAGDLRDLVAGEGDHE